MKTEVTGDGRQRTACGYVRVSTEDQKDHKISIASQIKAIERWCESNDVELRDIYSEPGLSGRDEGRPQFARMMDRATARERPYDIVVVHSLSRFARDVAIQAINYKRLQKAGVQQVSISEAFGKGSAGNLMRSVVSAFNQHYSEETAKHTRRSMRENARDGYFNGGKVPFGYRSVTVAHYGTKPKKRLEIDDAEAGLMRVMFQLATIGDGDGPMGVRGIAKWLNGRGHTLRGGRFHNSNVADILSRSHFVGFYLDGKKDDHGDPLPEAEWIRVPCPAIVDLALFEAAAALRATRQPRATPPRVTNGVTLLPSKIARCAEPGCTAGLTVRQAKADAIIITHASIARTATRTPAASSRCRVRRSTMSCSTR